MATEPEIQAGLSVLKVIAEAVIETVKEAGPQGAPAGVLYAALMTTGMNLEQFERLMGILVEVGKVRKQGQLYLAP